MHGFKVFRSETIGTANFIFNILFNASNSCIRVGKQKTLTLAKETLPAVYRTTLSFTSTDKLSMSELDPDSVTVGLGLYDLVQPTITLFTLPLYAHTIYLYSTKDQSDNLNNLLFNKNLIYLSIGGITITLLGGYLKAIHKLIFAIDNSIDIVFFYYQILPSLACGFITLAYVAFMFCKYIRFRVKATLGNKNAIKSQSHIPQDSNVATAIAIDATSSSANGGHGAETIDASSGDEYFNYGPLYIDDTSIKHKLICLPPVILCLVLIILVSTVFVNNINLFSIGFLALFAIIYFAISVYSCYLLNMKIASLFYAIAGVWVLVVSPAANGVDNEWLKQTLSGLQALLWGIANVLFYYYMKKRIDISPK